MNEHIKAVVFDMGGVIEISEGKAALDQIAEMIPAPIDGFKQEYWTHNYLSNVGNMTWEDMVVRVVKMFDRSSATEDRVRNFMRAYNAKKKINQGVIGLFPKLHDLGMKVAIFSNATTELRKRLTDKGIAPLVDEIVISGEIGYQKPSKEAFDVLFKKLNLNPENVVFIDDSAKSLEKADEIGYIPILFKNNEQLKNDLKTLGIPLA